METKIRTEPRILHENLQFPEGPRWRNAKLYFSDVVAGKVISVDENPIILEGEWDYSRLVMIRFNNEAEARCWYHSPEYQSLLKYRLNAATGTVLLTNDRVRD